MLGRHLDNRLNPLCGHNLDGLNILCVVMIAELDTVLICSYSAMLILLS